MGQPTAQINDDTVEPSLAAKDINPITLPYLTLPYHTGTTFYRLALGPLNGPNAHPRINHKVTKSPSAVLTWVLFPIPGTIPLPRGGLLT